MKAKAATLLLKASLIAIIYSTFKAANPAVLISISPLPVIKGVDLRGNPASVSTINVGCSVTALADAIGAANANPGPDTLELTSGCTYTLTSGPYDLAMGPNGLPIITSNITINGHGAVIARSTADGMPSFRIFEVIEGGALTLNQLSLANGNVVNMMVMDENYAGGGILNLAGTLTLDGCILSNNVAGYDGGGIANISMGETTAVLTLRHSTFASNLAFGQGGGVFNNGTLTVDSSTFNTNNAQQLGGALSNDGTAVVANSTLNMNFSAEVAGAVKNVGTLTFINSTLSGNIAREGVSGIESIGVTILKNTIVANNAPGGNCELFAAGIITDGGGNLVWGDTGFPTCPGSVGDPKLADLASNGGPTQTMALQAGSAAMDAGDDAICAASPVNNLDQRGFSRPHGAHCDIGAYEAGAAGPPQKRVYLPVIRK